jgi:hypothetical protein
VAQLLLLVMQLLLLMMMLLMMMMIIIIIIITIIILIIYIYIIYIYIYYVSQFEAEIMASNRKYPKVGSFPVRDLAELFMECASSELLGSCILKVPDTALQIILPSGNLT